MPIPLTEPSHELITLAGNDVYVLIGELAPLLAHMSLHDLPVALYLVVVHMGPLIWRGVKCHAYRMVESSPPAFDCASPKGVKEGVRPEVTAANFARLRRQ